MSTNPAPKDRVLPGLLVTGPAGFAIKMPPNVRSEPSEVVLEPVTVLSHFARSVEVGATPPTHLVPKARLSILKALTMGVPNGALEQLSKVAVSVSGELVFVNE